MSQEAPRSWSAPEPLCVLDDQAVNESSGIAASALRTGYFFTHNDSGDKPRFFRFASDGKVDGVYTLKGVKATDWEDMASAVVDDKPFLYIGDVGDNTENRESVVIYRVPEPSAVGEQTLEVFETYTVKYPDGSHNCEALFVTGNGDVWVVTKNIGGNSKVFVLSKPNGTGSYTFRYVAGLAVDTAGFGGKYVTGGDVSPDGKFVVIRTYTAALEYAVPEKFDDWTRSKPLTIRTAQEKQGEAICYSKTGKHLVTSSEFAPCPVSIIPLKGL